MNTYTLSETEMELARYAVDKFLAFDAAPGADKVGVMWVMSPDDRKALESLRDILVDHLTMEVTP